MSKFTYQPKNISQTPTNQIYKNKKRSTSQIKYQKAPDIMTQAKPEYLNNFVQPFNPHKSAFTPTNHSKNLGQKKLLLPDKSPEFANKKTLILDLDETLVHSSFVPFEKNDIILNVDFESVMYNIYVLVRPGAEEFIKKVSKYFEVVIFTASISKYALPLLDILDHEKKIKYRLTREHCTFLNGIYIKELKKLNRNLNDLIIVDNSPLAYAFDSDNGLPIKTWYDDPNDNELDKIYPLLEFLSRTNDVRKFINKFVNNNEIVYDIVNDFLKNVNENINNKNNIAINRNNDNKEDAERKAISVNINNNIKIKVKENNVSNINNFKNNNKLMNKIINKENNNIKISNEIPMKNNSNSQLFPNKLFSDKDKNNIKKEKSSKDKHNGTANLYNKNSKEKMASAKTSGVIQKKKNSFRAGPKLNEKLTFKNSSINLKNGNNIHYINNVNAKYPLNNNINNSNDILFSFSNTTKNKASPKTKIQYNNNVIEKNNFFNKSLNKEKKNVIYNKNHTLNYNSINNKYKYTNLLEKLESNSIKSNYSLSNKPQIINKTNKIFNGKNMLQKKKFSDNSKNKKINHIRVSSSLIGKYQALIINNTSNEVNKMNTNSNVSRSRSTGNFINFNKKSQKPKTPKGHFIFEKKIVVGVSKDNYINKNKKGGNIIEGLSTTRNLSDNHTFV